MAISATVTGKELGGITVTTKVFPNPLAVKFNVQRQVITITKANGDDEDVDISAATTLTGTISATAFTIVVS